MNESCPNTEETPQTSGLVERLVYVQEHFLKRRTRRLPVIVKFSTDTLLEQVHPLLDLLFALGYDGVNFGNGSTKYGVRREQIAESERRAYDYFISTFCGGVTGRPLKETSLELAACAADYVKQGPPLQEFHVIRTGGSETRADIHASDRSCISLN